MKYSEERKKYIQSYYLRHREKSLQQSKKWRDNNLERFKKYSYDYYINHKDSKKMKTYLHLYYLKHKEKIIEKAKKWHKDNPDKAKDINRRYRLTHKRVKEVNYKNLGLKDLFLQDYGMNVEKVDRSYPNGKRLFCNDCKDKGKNCKGFENCEYKDEVLEVIGSKNI